MKIIDELYQSVSFTISSQEMAEIIKHIKENKEKEIADIKAKINKYEQKKRQEEAFYQSLSPLRKFFTGRPSSQHQAVEYIFHVKERLKNIERIKLRIRKLNDVVGLLNESHHAAEEIVLSPDIIEEVKQFREQGGVRFDY